MLFFNDFGCSDLMLKKRFASLFSCLQYIFVCKLLFLIYILVSRNEILSLDVLYSNLIDGCFVLNSFKFFSRSVLLPVHIKNISSINVRYISDNVLINGYMNFLSKWSMIPMAQPFICKQLLQVKIKLFTLRMY